MGKVIPHFDLEITMLDLAVAPSGVSVERKFPLGKVVTTRGVHALITSGEFNPVPYMRRHHRCDWGDMSANDIKTNNRALRHGDRLMSVYKVNDRLTVWIITEYDRSVTTLLLPSEY
jgi:hypothetical protein